MNSEIMTKPYKILALDMDGTVLDDGKHQSRKVSDAINQALESGIEVVFCTGRAPTEMDKYILRAPKMKYEICESGALIYDISQHRVLSKTTIPEEKLPAIRDIGDGENKMVLAFHDGVIYMRDDPRLDEAFTAKFFSVKNLIRFWDKVCKGPLLAHMIEQKKSMEKINIYHLSQEDKMESLKKLQDANLNLELVYADMNSIEISPHGMSKAEGLKILCKILDVRLEEVAMVGDADNDLEAMKVAGFPIAMGNANERVKKAAKLVVSDNNHDGCAEAIEAVRKANGENWNSLTNSESHKQTSR